MKTYLKNALLLLALLLCASCYVGVPADYPPAPPPRPAYYPYYPYGYYPYYTSPGVGVYFGVPGIVIGGGHGHFHGGYRHW